MAALSEEELEAMIDGASVEDKQLSSEKYEAFKPETYN